MSRQCRWHLLWSLTPCTCWCLSCSRAWRTPGGEAACCCFYSFGLKYLPVTAGHLGGAADRLCLRVQCFFIDLIAVE